ncbi:MAG: sulfate transporter [Planctomycetaceae bacterium]|nr:sulfate transporter [Planctomycetaceae bacterium]
MQISYSIVTVSRDLVAGSVVFFVALPLCLGIALASGAPLVAGILAGIVGGVLVGLISKSHASVSGPAAGLAAIVGASIGSLGFETFLMAVVVGGALQIALGVAKAGAIVRYVPSSVINGLLVAIGLLLVLKQLPHLIGYEATSQTDLARQLMGGGGILSPGNMAHRAHAGAASIGIASTLLLLAWDRSRLLKSSRLPAPLAVVALGIVLGLVFRDWGGNWRLHAASLVDVPLHRDLSTFFKSLHHPDFSQILNPAVYITGLTIAVVASLETLLNLEAVEKLDPRKRTSPPSRELIAQGLGNVVVGLVGGLPITSVVVRGTVNIQAGAQTRLSAIAHGLFLLVAVALAPAWLNHIPLSCLAAILVVTGLKLASPSLAKRMYRAGWPQFVSFAGTVAAILLTDLLLGLLAGLAISLSFVAHGALRRPVRTSLEKHVGCDVVRAQLANQVCFLNRTALTRAFVSVPAGGHLLIDAGQSDYIDPDVADLIREFALEKAPTRGVSVSLRGFRGEHDLEDRVRFVDHASQELQAAAVPEDILEMLMEGNRRFRAGQRVDRDLGRQVALTAAAQHPLAVVISCIDSRTPAELVFDLGIGDVFSVRIAGNIVTREVLGSVEYACAVAGAKLVLVMGHTRCGAVAAAVQHARDSSVGTQMHGCRHLEPIAAVIRDAIRTPSSGLRSSSSVVADDAACDAVARENTLLMASRLTAQSDALRQLSESGRLAVHGAMYDVATGAVEVLPPLSSESLPISRRCA